MPDARTKPTVKQAREAARAAKVEELKRKQAREKRNRRLTAVIASVAGLAVVGTIITVVVLNGQRVAPEDIEIEGLDTITIGSYLHSDEPIDYDLNPPAGGDHAYGWLNCGVYEQPVPAENAVHSLEHGALWISYDPAEVDAAGVQQLRDAMPDTYVILAPLEDAPAPVVLTAWGQQLHVESTDDERIDQFIRKFWRSADVPEPNAVCTGAIDGAGKVA